MSAEYPKIMTRGGKEISVGGAADEAVKRAEGWYSPLDTPPQTDPDVVAEAAKDLSAASEDALDEETDDEPTFGPPGDQTHRKRGGKKR